MFGCSNRSQIFSMEQTNQRTPRRRSKNSNKKSSVANTVIEGNTDGVLSNQSNSNNQAEGPSQPIAIIPSKPIIIPPDHFDSTESNEPEKKGKKDEEKKKSIWAKLKNYAWRITASYIWLGWLTSNIGFGESVANFKAQVLRQVVTALSSLGFVPTNEAYLPTILKVGWMILITAFNPLELLVWVWLYIVSFPVLIFGASLYKSWNVYYSRKEKAANSNLKAQTNEKKKQSKRGLAKPKARSRIQVFTLSIISMLGWFLLFGGAQSRPVLISGAVLAGWIFWLSMMRLFRLAKVSTEDPTTPHNTLRKVGRFFINLARVNSVEDFETKHEVEQALHTHKVSRWFCKRIANVIGSSIREDRIPGLVLADYGLSLIFVGAAAILFWALVIKSAVSGLTFSECFYFSISYFLPNTQFSGSTSSLPLWVKWGPAATAWTLFVLYIGPVGGVVPERQKHTIERFSQTYKIYRSHIRKLNRSIQRLKRIEIVD